MPPLVSTCCRGIAAHPTIKPSAKLFTASLFHDKRLILRVRTTCKSYHDLKSTAESAYERARSLLPELERAQAIAAEARDPASESERRWQEAHSRLTAVQGDAHEAIQEVRSRALVALGGCDRLVDSMLRYHTMWRVQNFREKSPNVTAMWLNCPSSVTPLTWLPGAAMLAQTSITVKDEFPYLVASIAVAMPPFATTKQDALRSLVLHWSVADGSGAGWANSIPQGWHTSPSISHPCGSTAWQTHFAAYNPVLGDSKEGLNAVTVYSVIVQIPMQGFLESRGGIKYVLKRSDGGQPEWIKPGNNADFWLDFGPAIAEFAAIKQELEEGQLMKTMQEQQASQGLASLDAPDVDSIDEWEWVRILAANRSAEMGLLGSSDKGKATLSLEDIQSACAWLSTVSLWTEVIPNGDVSTFAMPEQYQSLSKQMEQLRMVLLAESQLSTGHLAHKNGEQNKNENENKINQKLEEIASLLQRCDQVDGALQKYDLASLEARKEQVEKERLWDMYKNASNEAARLEIEVAAAINGARKSVAALRGRNPPKEVTVEDLDRLAAGIAESSFAREQGAEGTSRVSNSLLPFWKKKSESNNGEMMCSRRLALLSRYQSAVQGLDGAVVAHVYLAQGKGEGEEKPEYDTIIISLGVGESFPEAETWGAEPPTLHFGMVVHQHGKWRPPPPGWRSATQTYSQNLSLHQQQQHQETGALPWVPLQPYWTETVEGRPAFVEPLTFGGYLALPLTDTVAAGFRGIEFVVKSQTGRWFQAAGGANFHVEWPLAR